MPYVPRDKGCSYWKDFEESRMDGAYDFGEAVVEVMKDRHPLEYL